MNTPLAIGMGALLVSCAASCTSMGPATLGEHARPCDALSPIYVPTLAPHLQWEARQRAGLVAPFFSRVPRPGFDTESLFMALVKDSDHGPTEVVYVLAPPRSPDPIDQFRVVHERAEDHVEADRPAPEIRATETLLDGATVLALERVWAELTGAARWRTSYPSGTIILHAKERPPSPAQTEFTFDYHGDKVRYQGWVFAPESGSCTLALAQIGETLMRLVDASDVRGRALAHAQLVDGIAALSGRLGIDAGSRCGGAPCLTPVFTKAPAESITMPPKR